MRIIVDFDVCESNGICEQLLPEVYELDENDFLTVKIEEPPEDMWEKARQTVLRCPKAAIRIEE